ncbi:MAG: hypothetical protein LBK82_17570 [Planctomycetaceae bacterium]|jgi:hypothetical protein|nr:hypothetical protein [Planctomycetaceae bacterium]
MSESYKVFNRFFAEDESGKKYEILAISQHDNDNDKAWKSHPFIYVSLDGFHTQLISYTKDDDTKDDGMAVLYLFNLDEPDKPGKNVTQVKKT